VRRSSGRRPGDRSIKRCTIRSASRPARFRSSAGQLARHHQEVLAVRRRRAVAGPAGDRATSPCRWRRWPFIGRHHPTGFNIITGALYGKGHRTACTQRSSRANRATPSRRSRRRVVCRECVAAGPVVGIADVHDRPKLPFAQARSPWKNRPILRASSPLPNSVRSCFSRGELFVF